MFREMLRSKQQLSKEECIVLLKQQNRGVLSVLGDDGYPYGVPMNHWYCEENGRLYFHGGFTGHKIDALKNCNKVSFCVYDQGYRKDGEWPLYIKSVIVFGRVNFIDDQDRAMNFTRELSFKFTSDTSYIEREIEDSGKRTLCFELIPEHISGKLVKEA